MRDLLPAPLRDVRVLDLAGPLAWYGTKLLADLGADVIRLEPPGGDPARRRPPFVRAGPAQGESLAFWYFNTSKRSELIDLTQEEGCRRLRALARDADVVVDTALPAERALLGIDYAALARRNPRLVYVLATPFGTTGPYQRWQASDLILQALGGLMFLAGLPTRPPSQLGGNQAEYQTGVLAACGALLGLAARDHSGRGQLVEVIGQVAVAIDAENALPYWDFERWVRPRLGVENYLRMRQLFRCRDGWVVVSIGNRWQSFRRLLERAGLLSEELADPAWNSADYRAAHAQTIERACEALCAAMTRDEIWRLGQEARVGVAPVQRIDELFADPQLAARAFWQRVPHPEIERDITYPGPPFRLSATPWRIFRRPPLAGEHSGEGWLPRPRAPRSAPPARRDRLPLEGVRVIDLSWVAAAPLATRLMALFGAEVLRIESATRPDSSRRLPTARPPGNDSLNASGMWNNLNPGKASVVLDLTHPEAVRLLERFIQTADVLVDNFGVDPYPKWGLTLARLRALRPDLIIARASTMGRTGPRQHFIGLGYTIGAAAGHHAITGFPDDPPAGAGIAHPDYSCNPYHLAVAVLAALHYRRRTGVGQTIDLAQHESTVCWVGVEAMDYAVNGVVAGPCANRSPDAAPHGAYPALGDDAWIAIACQSDAQFAALAAAMEQPHLATDPRFSSLAARKANEDALDQIVARWTRRQPARAAAARLQQLGIPAGPVQSHRDLVEEDPQMRSIGHYVRIEHHEVGVHLADGPPVRLTSTPGRVSRPAPLLGEDTERLLRELLGLDEEEIVAGYLNGWLR
ncbi:MAG: CoA transferase [Chloroflexota bacterium]|nr:CoA transferase [Dehalococcoidia bacterium]MDW8254203.1 CoA transferase [Chloroflexota bacterium]